MSWPVFPALALLGIGACVAFLVCLAYGVSAYANAIANNGPAFWREMLRGLIAFLVLSSCVAGIVAIGVAIDAAPPEHVPSGVSQEGGKP